MILQYFDKKEALNDLEIKAVECIVIFDISIYFLLLVALYHLIIVNNYISYILIFMQRMNRMLCGDAMPLRLRC